MNILVENHLLNLNVLTQIGEISEKKIKQLKNHGFELKKQVPGQFAQFQEMRTDNTIVVAQNEIVYAANASSFEAIMSNPGVAVDIFVRVLDILLLDGDSVVLKISFERSYPADHNTFDQSWKMLDSSVGDVIRASGAKAVGLRIPFEKEMFSGEYKIEPFFSNPSRYFLACGIQTQKPASLDHATHLFGQMLGLISDEFDPMIIDLFKRE